jgi:hypothetical protein
MRTIGRKGSGPGEFSEASILWMLPGDSLVIFDRDAIRVTVLKPDYAIARSMRTSINSGTALMLSTGKIVVSTRSVRPESFGLPLQLRGTGGRTERSFGATDRIVARTPPPHPLIELGRARADSFWVARSGRYDIELWTAASDRPVTILRRNVAWYAPYSTTSSSFSPEGTPLPAVRGLREDANRRLWVVVQHRDPAFRGREIQPNDRNSFLISIRDAPQILEAHLEVIDRISGRLVASTTFPGPVRFVTSTINEGGVLHSWREDEQGYLFLDVWHAQLISPPQ